MISILFRDSDYHYSFMPFRSRVQKMSLRSGNFSHLHSILAPLKCVDNFERWETSSNKWAYLNTHHSIEKTPTHL